MARRQTTKILMLIAVFLIILILIGMGLFAWQSKREGERPVAQVEERSPATTPSPMKPVQKKLSPLQIDGFRIGMTFKRAEALLRKKKIDHYTTDFTDMLVYNPAPDTEMALSAVCTAGGPVLGRITRSTVVSMEQTDADIAGFRRKLAAKYGTPARVRLQPDGLDLCWGACKHASLGTKLKVTTSGTGRGERIIGMVLENPVLYENCSDIQQKNITRWLNRWAIAVQKFEPGMRLDDAAAVYVKRYREKLNAVEERDESFEQPVLNFVVREYDFFPELDFESHAFAGEGPGRIVLKFTGNQAGEESLNKRLYYSSFSTTNFTDRHIYDDFAKKLETFVKTYGNPVEVLHRDNSVTARWESETKQIKATISDSGLMTFEQTDILLKDLYRNAVNKIE